MERNKQEIISNPEQNLEKLKDSLLEIINQYNSEPAHRMVKPINGFGESLGEMSLFWAHWSDNFRSTHPIGFTYNSKDKKLTSLSNEENIPFNNASDRFLEDLKNIPEK
jgi:hypothetical protein